MSFLLVGYPYIQEFAWDEIDERYKKMGSLHKDTIETLFPELKDTEINNPEYPTYLTVEDNDVVMHLNVVMNKVDADMNAMASFLEPLKQTETNRVINRLSDDDGVITFKKLALDGIKNRWEGIYYGNKYDFHEGLSFNFSIEISEDVPQWGQKMVALTFIDGLCGISNQGGLKKDGRQTVLGVLQCIPAIVVTKSMLTNTALIVLLINKIYTILHNIKEQLRMNLVMFLDYRICIIVQQ